MQFILIYVKTTSSVYYWLITRYINKYLLFFLCILFLNFFMYSIKFLMYYVKFLF